MSIISEKRSYIKSFFALAFATLMLFSSLATVTAATGAVASGAQTENAEASAQSALSISDLSPVVLDLNGVKTAELFNGGTVADFLKATHTEVGDNQIVIPALNTELKTNDTVYVRDAKPVTVTDSGKTKLMVLPCGTVEEALALVGIPLGKEDIVDVKRDARIESLNKLTVSRVTVKQTVETAEIAYESETENSDEVELGETEVGTVGQNGEKRIVKEVKYIDGKAVSEKTVSETVTKQPVNEVILVGTKGAGTTGGAGTFTDTNGNKVAYSRVLTGSGTAYTAPADSGTATGVTAYHGGVAINPDLIPYGSKLYVESTDGSFVYGYCTAVDTGGALMDGSAIVDCFYDTYDECVNFGRRDVNVYVISE